MVGAVGFADEAGVVGVVGCGTGVEATTVGFVTGVTVGGVTFAIGVAGFTVFAARAVGWTVAGVGSGWLGAIEGVDGVTFLTVFGVVEFAAGVPVAKAGFDSPAGVVTVGLGGIDDGVLFAVDVTAPVAGAATCVDAFISGVFD